MADDARISTALPRHPKTVKLQRQLGTNGCWSLLCLFLWVAENRPDGDLRSMSADDIEIAANWYDKPGEFVRVLVAVRFLDGEEEGYRIHDWVEHNPYVAGRPKRVEAARRAVGARWSRATPEQRTEAGRQAAKARWEQDAASGNGKSDACGMHTESTHDACGMHTTCVPPSLPLPSKSKTSLSELKSSSDQLSPPAQKNQPKRPSQDACRLAALLKSEILRNRADYRITQAQERKWETTAQRMIEIDKREPQEIAELIRWAQRDEFWMSNILSMGKLREQFDQLALRAKGNTNRKATGPVPLPPSYISPSEEIRRQQAAVGR